jgi:hypothetical protein
MHARVGDHIHVNGRHVGDPARDGTITEVRGPGGSPPYMVRWDDAERPALVFPGSDALVSNLPLSGLGVGRFH